MRVRLAAALVGATLMLAAAPPQTPEQAWRAGILDANKDWAKIPHAILKIQDAAYLGEGQSASLTGSKGKPASYRWVPGKVQDGVLTVTFHAGHMSGAMHGKPLDDATLQKSVPIDTDIDIQGFPTQVSAGVIGVRVMLYNQLRADALNFKGVDYFPYDPAYRITATFKPDPKLPPRVFRTSRGTDKQFFHAGDATFRLQGKTFTLPFYASDNDPKKIADMSAFFMDDLTGTVTYGSGRYVDIDSFGAFPPETATIDFNDAYNPNCARSAFYTCPVATDTIALAIEAGEKDPHHAH
ncbi:MAG TPA: DUF1684 domain-containing protein [Rhizomicrobium sp.]|jgi:uncharacterized protein (DUF1684 family)|nr:DUF1684 domain-containing protein [Rhizomicrobium sp.]